ncbi:unnamed protein product [Cylicostephanus goldi]|uniref:TOG domain-containing protein n=1 Tax=Cylicostephanus goldi TaxID=71465 RepID=A0A3P7MBI9_CYLGO|nr:unnamed protein product [Cylicostephanus goldi]
MQMKHWKRSKNNTIRASCAGFVGTLVSRMGVSALLNTPDQLSKIVPHLIAFSKDANPQVRMHGKQTLLSLSQGGIDSLDSTSVSLGASLSRSGSIRKAVQRKLPDNVQLDLDEIKADLTAAGWERRIGGLKRFLEMTITAPKAIASDTKLMEAFIGRLNDINSKVSLEGLDTYLASLGILSKMYSTESNLKAVLNQLVLALMSHLSSKSEEHRTTAQKCLRDTVVQIG